METASKVPLTQDKLEKRDREQILSEEHRRVLLEAVADKDEEYQKVFMNSVSLMFEENDELFRNLAER
ncbi:hypothetical protein IQ278_12010 [Tolypothrix sp. LEGE 11397]|uniref:hypothetical protein n=1 Tax=Tolypothrix sp. LEGE 11397 TaxID=2777971 RepID=UPI00187E3754|nr:hypothetical protein [Tolypothrix sp. LEGE 11397]MBE9082838.1 hypothetical protein [Tolypothrix sp. LEGE 11397]